MRGQQGRKGCWLLGYYKEVFSRAWMVRSGHFMRLFWFFGDDLEPRETRFKLQLDRDGRRGGWHNPQVMPARVGRRGGNSEWDGDAGGMLMRVG